MTLLQITNLSKSFKSRTVVDNVSFSINDGEIFGLLGPNGAGKSTTLSMVCGLLKADSGNISIGGYDLKTDSFKAKELIGIVPQETALYPELSAVANLKFWGSINGIEGRSLDYAINNALTLVDLKDRALDRIGKYSGGMKRRLNIAAGLIHNPKLLIMDEPTVGVDPQSRNHILDTIRTLKDQGTTIIYTSHYVEEVEQLCDRVAIMDHGKLLTIGTLAELQHEAGELHEVTVAFSSLETPPMKQIQGLTGVKQAALLENSIKILTPNAEQLLPLLFEMLVSNRISITEIKIKKPNLESLFLKLTGRALRD
ncbi:ABC transporter ATP-binding protein [Desulfuribacillus alkaliarsenatis]|uniref:Export ABC transporter ATP-binding protein n=1 Tax=Desulfuribacillus alkaliarsenatis TaxID=766136 RepID=A0A1E5G374_9FIRM|nr:ABC transporter ATP-binding protein [Desulfuribacillus alkaliarsenatis]OEF97434.1 export ABC transporter ATP-binding protein [Desulfuribacillus alkaliarsenatis]